MPPHCTVAIKAIPNAPRSQLVGWLGDALKVKIHAPPVEGRANEALCQFLADTLGVSRRAVTVLRGDTSRQKLVRIDGLSPADLKAKIAAVLPIARGGTDFCIPHPASPVTRSLSLK